MATPSPRAQTMLPAGCSICVPTRSWWFTHMTTSSVASPPWRSPRAAAYCWPATTISTATSGTLWRPTALVSKLRRVWPVGALVGVHIYSHSIQLNSSECQKTKKQTCEQCRVNLTFLVSCVHFDTPCWQLLKMVSAFYFTSLSDVKQLIGQFPLKYYQRQLTVS